MFFIFADTVEDSMEVFMDDFSMVGDTLKGCIIQLKRVLQCCVETKLGEMPFFGQGRDRVWA